MSVKFDLAKENADFLRTFRRVILGCVIFGSISVAASTYSTLMNVPALMHDWRGITCILLTAIFLLLYGLSVLNLYKFDWPPPLLYAASMWGTAYLVVLALALID